MNRKKKLDWAVKRTRLLLARNACHHETFYGALNRADVRALRTLAGFALRALVANETYYLGSAGYPVKPIMF